MANLQLNTKQVISLMENTKELLDASQQVGTALTQSQQQTIINIITSQCQEMVFSTAEGPVEATSEAFIEIPYAAEAILVLGTISAFAMANAAKNACTLLAQGDLAALQAQLNNMQQTIWNAQNNLGLNSQQSYYLQQMMNQAANGNVAAAVAFGTQFIEVSNFLGVTPAPNGAGFIYQQNGVSISVSPNFIPETASLVDYVSTTNPTAIDTQFLNPDGSGGIKVQGQTIDYAAGASADVSAGSGGTDTIAVVPNSGNAVILNVTNGQVSATAGGNSFSDTLANSKAIVDARGDIEFVNNTATKAYNDAGQLIATSQINGGSPATATVYNPTNGVVVEQDTINADTSMIRQFYDPTSGALLYTNTIDSTGHIVSSRPAANISFGQLAGVVANALAGQAISQFLLKHNLPASVAVQAFANAGVTSIATEANGGAVTAQSFSTSFAAALTNMAGGILGSDEGIALFKSLGLPTQLGSLAGSALGGAAAQQLSAFIASDVLGIDTSVVTSSIGSVGADAFESALGSAFVEGGFALAGSELEEALFTNKVGPGAAIGGAIGAGIGTYIGATIGSVVPFLGTALGAFVGDFLGSLFGGLFGGQPSVGPNAGADVGYIASTNSFAIVATGEDNGGDVTVAESLANAAIATLDNVLNVMGGTVVNFTNAQKYSYGYFEGQFYARDYATGLTTNQFSNASDAVSDGVYRTLRSITIQGGNPYMQYMLQNSTATNLSGLLSDLNAAHDYSAYVANPLAFDASLVMSGDSNQLATWQAELARIQALGLDQLTNVQLASIQTFGSIVTVTPSYLTQNATVMGTGINFSTQGEQDYFTQLPTGQVVLWAFNSSGAPVSAQTLTYTNGNTFTYSLGTKILATARNLLGADGYDLIVQAPNGQIGIHELSTLGQPLVGGWPTYTNGTSYAIPIGTQVIGTAHSLLGAAGGYDLIIVQPGTGQIGVQEFTSQSQVGNGIWLSYSNGSAFTYGAGTQIIGTARNLAGTGGYDLIALAASGQVGVHEFNAQGQPAYGTWLTYTNGTAYTLPIGTQVIGTAHALLGGVGSYDLIITQPGTGQVGIQELNSQGQVGNGVWLTNTNGTALTFASGAVVIGTGNNILLAGGFDLIVQQPNGTIVPMEFSTSTGTMLAGGPATVIGTAQNLLGTGGSDKILQLANANLVALEYNSSGVAVKSATLTHSYGGPLTYAANSVLLGTAMNLNGTGSANPDLILQQPDGSIIVAEFNNTGSGAVTLWNELANSDGSNYILPTGLTLLGTGSNFLLQGGPDLILQETNGTIVPLEFSSSNGTVLAGGVGTVIGTAQNLLGTGGSDKILQFANGNLLALEYNSSGVLVANRSLTYSNGTLLTLTSGTVVIGAGQNWMGDGGTDLLFQTPNLGLTAYEFGTNGQIVGGNDVLWYYTGATVTVEAGTTLIGTNSNVLQNGGFDLFLQQPDGTFYAMEISKSTGMVLAGGAAAVIGSASNLLGTGGTDTILQVNSDQDLVTLEYNSSGAVVASKALTYSNGTLLTMTQGTVVLGSAQNLMGDSGTDLVFQAPSGGLTAYEFNSSGSVVAGNNVLWNWWDGSTTSIATGSTLIGTTTNAYRSGGFDLIFQQPNGSIVAEEFDKSTGMLLDGGAGTFIGTATSLLGTGGTDQIIQINRNQEIYALEYNASGVLTASSALVYSNGSPIQLTAGSIILGTSHNLMGAGGTDIVFQNPSGGLTAYEVNSSGAVVAGNNVLWNWSDGSTITLPVGTSLIGTDKNDFGDNGFNLIFQTPNGQIRDFEFNPSTGMYYEDHTLAYSNGAFSLGSTNLTVGATIGGMTVAALGSNALGTGGNDLVLHNAGTGQTITTEVNSSGVVAGTEVTTVVNGVTTGELFIAGPGNLGMGGGTGYDTFRFGLTFGQDVINSAGGPNAEIDFSAGITNQNLWFQQSGNDLLIEKLGTNDMITVANWFGSSAAQVQHINTATNTLPNSQVQQLVQAMASYAANNSGFNPTTATSMPTNSTLQAAVAANWQQHA